MMRTNKKLSSYIERLKDNSPSAERQKTLQVLIDYIRSGLKEEKPVLLNFICTHNSRRSHFAQIWAATLANHFQVPLESYSGGVEVTSFNPKAVAALERTGFAIVKGEGPNPVYEVYADENPEPIHAFSKTYDDQHNPSSGFAAVMVCSDAEQNCPYIPAAEKRMSITYGDPKDFDGTELESQKYDERCAQIAAEMYYVFNSVKNGR